MNASAATRNTPTRTNGVRTARTRSRSFVSRASRIPFFLAAGAVALVAGISGCKGEVKGAKGKKGVSAQATYDWMDDLLGYRKAPYYIASGGFGVFGVGSTLGFKIGAREWEVQVARIDVNNTTLAVAIDGIPATFAPGVAPNESLGSLKLTFNIEMATEEAKALFKFYGMKEDASKDAAVRVMTSIVEALDPLPVLATITEFSPANMQVAFEIVEGATLGNPVLRYGVRMKSRGHDVVLSDSASISFGSGAIGDFEQIALRVSASLRERTEPAGFSFETEPGFNVFATPDCSPHARHVFSGPMTGRFPVKDSLRDRSCPGKP